jgi:hypothetical protein
LAREALDAARRANAKLIHGGKWVDEIRRVYGAPAEP